jgi:hypothetical protein
MGSWPVGLPHGLPQLIGNWKGPMSLTPKPAARPHEPGSSGGA